VDIHNHWLRQEVLNGSIEVVYTPSAQIMADGLTKALQNTAFKAFVCQIGLVDVKDQLEERGLREISAEQLDEEIQDLIDGTEAFQTS